MIIRKFEPEDFEGVLEIESVAFSEHNPFLYMNFYEMNNEGFLVAEEKGHVVGFVVGYKLSENEGRIFSLAVREGYQGYGIGTQLIKAIIGIFQGMFLKYSSLEVRVSNLGAQKLYNRMNFIPCWIEHGYYSDGEDGIIMKRQLLPLENSKSGSLTNLQPPLENRPYSRNTDFI
ncbi:ribosomal protein S18-alanine N-acetyltransferase [Methanolobus sp. ZRKC3]|uniref:ribosomal protein S18-alanine N-acetyltransferase n=1 Tax=Methanolobus sp. ZRKC3 TaxID=3125786 RepID=UPI00324DD88D